MPHRITLIPGDGIGPEVAAAARRTLDATGVELDWDVQEAGAPAVARDGTPFPRRVLDSIRENGVALKGPVATPVERGAHRASPFDNANVALRRELDLYASVRPCRWMPGVRSRYRDVDVVVIRENTEGMYTGFEFEQGEVATKELISFIAESTGEVVREDSGISVKAISVAGSERIVRFAFEYARANGRSRITAGHKANIMKLTDGLFLQTARRVAAEHPDVAFEDRIIDALCMQLAQAPQRFDVLVLPNLYGDIVSDLCAGLIGGLGIAPGGHFGDGCAVFETTHGSAPTHAGEGRANPTAMMLSGAMLLRHLGEIEAAERLEAAVAAVIAEGRSVTYDLKPSPDDPSAVGTEAFTDAVVERLTAVG